MSDTVIMKKFCHASIRLLMDAGNSMHLQRKKLILPADYEVYFSRACRNQCMVKSMISWKAITV